MVSSSYIHAAVRISSLDIAFQRPSEATMRKSLPASLGCSLTHVNAGDTEHE